MKICYLICSIMVVSWAARSQSQENLLMRTWKVDDPSIPVLHDIYLERIRKSNPEQLKALEAMPNALTEVVRSIRYHYKENGICEVLSVQGTQTAHWKIVGRSLLLQYTSGREVKDSIVFLSADRLTLFSSSAQKAISYVAVTPTTTQASFKVDIESEKRAIQVLVEKFSSALKAKDSLALKKLFYQEKVAWTAVAHPQSLEYLKKFTPTQQEVDRIGAYAMLSSPQMKDVSIEERFYNPVIETDGRLASATFDYASTVQGTVSNWGRENWQLVKVNNEWKILSLLYSYHMPAVEPVPAALQK